MSQKEAGCVCVGGGGGGEYVRGSRGVVLGHTERSCSVPP